MEKFKDILAYMGRILLFFIVSVSIVLLILNAPQVTLVVGISFVAFVVVLYITWSFYRIFNNNEYGGEE
jgi:hypothetical protein